MGTCISRSDLAVNIYWGLQIAQPFPSDESIGIRFHVEQYQHFDFYLDDIFLLR